MLKPDNILKTANGLEINQKIIPNSMRADKNICSYIKQGEPVKPCKKMTACGITIHNTEDISVNSATNPAEQYARATYNGNMKGVVVHFYVFENHIWQLLAGNEQGWHAGDGATRRCGKRSGTFIGGNLDTIAIECIGNNGKSEETTAKLVAWLCKEYGLSVDLDVYTHSYFATKNCPAYILPHLEQFMATVSMEFEQLKKPKEFTIEDKKIYKVQVGAFYDYDYAKALCNRLHSMGFSSYIVTEEKNHDVKIGDNVKLKAGCTDYNGNKIADFAFEKIYLVEQLKDDRAVLDLANFCTAVNVSDLEVIKC